MTDDDRLTTLTAELERLAVQLRSGELDAAAAADLADQCAQLAGEAAAELERRVRAAAAEPQPDDAQLALTDPDDDTAR